MSTRENIRLIARAPLTHYIDTKRAHDSQIVRAKENLKLSHGGPSQRQVSATNQPIKASRQDHHCV